MNYIKQAFLILFMAMLAISCSDDTTVETDGDGSGDLTPNTKVVITTEIDGNVEHTKTMELIDDSFVPSSVSITGSYNETNDIFVIQFLDIENSIPKFQVGISARMDSYTEGSYSFTSGDNKFNTGNYMNKELDESNYTASSVEFNITDTKYLGFEDRSAGTYYTSGDITMVLSNGEQTITVKINLESAPIGYTNLNI